MKMLICCLLFFSSVCCFAQQDAYRLASFKTKKEKAVISPDTLSHLLTAGYTTELEKVRAIFYWITENIEYNTVRYQFRYKPENDNAEADYDADSLYKSLDERVARITIKRGYALCDGYARLFKTLCDFAGVKSEVITGYGRTNSGNNQFYCNHKWNAVMIDSNWYLLDATWASGYLNFSGTSFIRDYNANYFLSAPKYFIQDHYPDDIKWTLLANPSTLAEFNRSPFRQPAFNYKIISYQPSKGIINAVVGDTIRIELETSDEKKTLFLTDANSVDSSLIAFSDSCNKINKTFTESNNKISATYFVTSEEAQWLQVIYNSNVILRYKLNIHKAPFNYLPIIIKDIAVNR